MSWLGQRPVLCVLVVGVGLSSAFGLDLNSIELGVNGAVGRSAEPEIASITGYGVDISVAWRITKALDLRLSSLHRRNHLEDDQAHLHWNWEYWQKIYGYTVYILDQDPAYNVNFMSVQLVDSKPILAGLGYHWRLDRKMQPFGGIQTGPVWYGRKLYLEENWEKHFPSIDYVFTYHFRNAADTRKGWVWAVRGTGGVDFQWHPNIGISMQMEWIQYFDVFTGSDYFPVQSLMSAQIMVRFYY